jgi:hypothetical protein
VAQIVSTKQECSQDARRCEVALILDSISFPVDDRAVWIAGWKRWNKKTQERLMKGLPPSFLTRFISRKARVRPGRFFGEAFVARKWGYEKAWYSSFKWLTAKKWSDGKSLTDPWQREFKAALQTLPRLRELQQAARRFATKVGFKPVAPDLWLIRGRQHYFLETKLPGDHVSDSQLAGLALLATCPPVTGRVHVGVVYLFGETSRAQSIPRDIEQRFNRFRAIVSRLNERSNSR